MYCDYTTYQALGGTMSAGDYAIWGERATRKINAMTLGRAAIHTAELTSELQDACARLADALKQQDTVAAGSTGLASASNDGYSETYLSPAEQRGNAQRSCFAILRDSLGEDRYGLLYAGVL